MNRRGFLGLLAGGAATVIAAAAEASTRTYFDMGRNAKPTALVLCEAWSGVVVEVSHSREGSTIVVAVPEGLITAHANGGGFAGMWPGQPIRVSRVPFSLEA